MVVGGASPGGRLESSCGTGRVARLGQGTGYRAGTRPGGGLWKKMRKVWVRILWLEAVAHRFLRCEIPCREAGASLNFGNSKGF